MGYVNISKKNQCQNLKLDHGSSITLFFLCRLRMQLLGVWTLNVKRIGKSLIWFMLLVVKDFGENDVSIHLKKYTLALHISDSKLYSGVELRP